MGEGVEGARYAAKSRGRNKISARQFSGRFERARAIASLNHSNICTIHDVGAELSRDGTGGGPTLAERIGRGPVPREEALDITKQIADVLEAVHTRGIVHRDLRLVRM